MFRKNKIWIWLVGILLVTNVSTIVSVVYHLRNESNVEQPAKAVEMPGEQRTRFFKEQLGLAESQMDQFRNANRQFNRQARQVTMQLEMLREEFVQEMTKEHSDEQRMAELSKLIGQQHEKLKMATYSFYEQLNEACTSEQKEKLAELFQSLISTDKNIKLPERQRGKFRNRR